MASSSFGWYPNTRMWCSAPSSFTECGKAIIKSRSSESKFLHFLFIQFPLFRALRQSAPLWRKHQLALEKMSPKKTALELVTEETALDGHTYPRMGHSSRWDSVASLDDASVFGKWDCELDKKNCGKHFYIAEFAKEWTRILQHCWAQSFHFISTKSRIEGGKNLLVLYLLGHNSIKTKALTIFS